jgi:hypothetical protein
MGERNQIDGSYVCLNCYVGTPAQGRYQPSHDGLPRRITDVKDATSRVGCFMCEQWLTIRSLIKVDRSC